MNLDKLIDEIRRIIEEEKPKTVLLQLPDGLKPYAKRIVDAIDGVEVFIWAGSNYGACDIPQVEVDLVINVGHAPIVTHP